MIVGPNGSGKSNISEAVLWCMGEQSPLAVRGQSMQDVIFSGSHGVSSRKSAEVELVFDNSDGRLPIEFSEVSISRRLDRKGDGEYRVNGARCRLIDVLELLSDAGMGKEMHSVVSQGSIEEIVHSKPQQRRLMIEEAAGLGKHRKRRRRAQLKLEHTQENLDRALDVEKEARSHLRPLKRQAEAAEHHRRLERQSLETRVKLVADSLRLHRDEQGKEEAHSARAIKERDEVEAQLALVAKQRGQAEQSLAQRGNEREALTEAYFASQTASENVILRLDQSREVLNALRSRVQSMQEAQRAEEERQAQLRLKSERAERTPGGAPAAPIDGAQWLLGDLEIEGGTSKLAKLLLDDAWVVEDIDHLTDDFEGTAITHAGWAYFGFDLGSYRLIGDDGTVEKVDAGRLTALKSSERVLRQLVEQAEQVVNAMEGLSEAVLFQRDKLERQFEESRDEGAEVTKKLQELAGSEHGLQSKLRQANTQVTEHEVRVSQARDRGSEIVSELEQIRSKLGVEVEAAKNPLGEDEKLELETKIERLERRREKLGPVNPLAKQEYEQALTHVQDLKRQREDLDAAIGELQKLIRDTDRLIKERFEKTFDLTAKNFEDMVSYLFPGGNGRIELVKIERPRTTLGGAMDREAVPGEQSDDQEEEIESAGDEEQDMGVEVEVTPAGKNMRRLSLLSGGEKSLVALAFLFAVFLAKPCPFYILDEVEAALDDANIDRFLGLVRRYSDRAQFIVVTHQRRTMDAANVLYGVSMGEDGISKVVSRKMGDRSESLSADTEVKAA